jgi:apolipoprotein N-acyltransferase
MNFPTSDPSWVLPLAVVLIALLLACLIGFVALPLRRPTISRPWWKL